MSHRTSAAPMRDRLPEPDWRGISACHVRCAAERKSTRALAPLGEEHASKRRGSAAGPERAVHQGRVEKSNGMTLSKAGLVSAITAPSAASDSQSSLICFSATSSVTMKTAERRRALAVKFQIPETGQREKNGAELPDPSREESDLRTPRMTAPRVDGEADCSGYDALNAKQHDRRSDRIDAEETEDQGRQIRINGGDPSGRTGCPGKRAN